MLLSPPVSVWILGDQLLQNHPTLTIAEAAVGRAHLGATDLRCLAHAITGALDTGYTHHIERLMLPNVLAMGLNADGGRMATKPYIASASYINRMSDYCTGCVYDPKRRTGPGACPFTWRKSLAKNWDQVKYCSDACRRYKASGGKPDQRS
jgi:deoxyribodipyrimidine photolyase-like uncharacterized protein